MLGLMPSCKCQKEVLEPSKAMNVIYFIGDGTALPQVYAGMLATRQELVFPISQVPLHWRGRHPLGQ